MVTARSRSQGKRLRWVAVSYEQASVWSSCGNGSRTETVRLTGCNATTAASCSRAVGGATCTSGHSSIAPTTAGGRCGMARARAAVGGRRWRQSPPEPGPPAHGSWLGRLGGGETSRGFTSQACSDRSNDPCPGCVDGLLRVRGLGGRRQWYEARARELPRCPDRFGEKWP